MAALSESDLRVMVGPDYERIMKTSAAITVTSTPEEHAASRALREKRLSDMNFTIYAMMFTGISLIGGGLYTGVGFVSMQCLAGLALLMLAIAFLGLNISRSRTIARETEAARLV